MGKCSKCGKKIEYNNYQVIDGIVYCPNCTPKKEAEKISEVLVKTVKDSKVKFDEFEKALDEAKEVLADTIANDPDIEDELKEEKKPRKRRGKK